MGGKCRYCGGAVEWKDTAGFFRKFCEECAERVADGEQLQATYDPDGTPE